MIKKLKYFIYEIKTIGFIDWLWFVIFLKRDEFNPKLSLSSYYFKYTRDKYDNIVLRCINSRKRAHDIDCALREMRFQKFKIEHSNTNDNTEI